jgi:proteic killer suppression protein
MIKSFRCKKTEQLFLTQKSRHFSPSILEGAMRKLLILQSCENLKELMVFPANSLEQLQGNRMGQWSIRINKQWRVFFEWDGKDIHNVEIVDYH